MKMSQSEIFKDSVSDWSINMPGVSEKTRGNGRNGTEQRALEGIWNNCEWIGRAFCCGRTGEIAHLRQVKSSIGRDSKAKKIQAAVLWNSSPETIQISKYNTGKAEVKVKKKSKKPQNIGEKSRVMSVKKNKEQRLKITKMPSHNLVCLDTK